MLSAISIRCLDSEMVVAEVELLDSIEEIEEMEIIDDRRDLSSLHARV